MFVFLDGKFLPAHEAKISVFDGGYMYGDGIYTTMRLYEGLPLDLTAHHARLSKHAAALQIRFDFTCDQLSAIIAELVAQNKMAATDGRLRITVSRHGDPDDPLPLTDLTEAPATVLMTLAPIAQALLGWQQDGIAVICLGGTFARGNFPKLKTLNSLATITALRQAASAGCPEALLSDDQGNLLEGAVSNIFVVEQGALRTPINEGAFLAGRTRERILNIAKKLGLMVHESKIKQIELVNADEIFVVSSVREVLPVVSTDGVSVGDGKPGPITKKIQESYRQLISHELNSI